MIERNKTYKTNDNEEETPYITTISDEQYYDEDILQQNYNFYQQSQYGQELDSLEEYNASKYHSPSNSHHTQPSNYTPNYNGYNQYNINHLINSNNVNVNDYYKENAPEISSDNGFAEEKKPRKCGRKKIKMAFIEGKNKRSVTFSKRKKGIMKKAYELNILTGTEILLLVASESGHVYTFATPKLKPIIANHENLIQQCLNAPNLPERNMGYMAENNETPQKDNGYSGEYYERYNKYWNQDRRG
ncbi:MADS domain protein [Spraguea lophii 42_110]|uniref:MADS domain protein n=1 Tax=Spraguea lophii (strain 42_110) TaxID=1358809 RepID=S7WB12_SPRLO|nr:MADS domain protein [Spraguea lophii 42_110]